MRGARVPAVQGTRGWALRPFRVAPLRLVRASSLGLPLKNQSIKKCKKPKKAKKGGVVGFFLFAASWRERGKALPSRDRRDHVSAAETPWRRTESRVCEHLFTPAIRTSQVGKKQRARLWGFGGRELAASSRHPPAPSLSIPLIIILKPPHSHSSPGSAYPASQHKPPHCPPQRFPWRPSPSARS